jgi:predicted ArsR family transcriptional regulator
MPENSEKNHQKIFKNNVNPHGTGVLRFTAFEIIKNSHRPITVSELIKKLKVTEPTVRREWVLRVLEEISLAQMGVQRIEKRVGRTKAYAYYITSNQKNGLI